MFDYVTTLTISTMQTENEMNEAKINRMVAKQAARGVYLYAHQGQLSEIRDRLLAEAKEVDRFYCSDNDMMTMAEAEYRKLRGNALGGHVTAAKRK